MIYKLNLDSTNKYSGTNNAQLVYAVDWSFLPDNKKFKVTFSFQTKKRATTGFSSNFTNYLECDLGSSFENYSGSNTVSKTTNNFLGVLLPKLVLRNSAVETILYASPKHNKPVYIGSRPTNNFITVSIDSYNFVLSASITTDYFMTIFFEEIP